MMARAVALLPLPDSPTIATVSLGLTWNVTDRTASTISPESDLKRTERPPTSTNGEELVSTMR
jgi:hypothetical protein